VIRATVVAGALAALSAAVISGCSAQSPEHHHPAPAHAVPAAPAAPTVQAVRAPLPMAAPKAPTPADAPPNPCAHNNGRQLVRVSLRRQHVWLCAHRHLAYSSPVTSGMVGQYTSTPTGNYEIQGLDRNTVLTLITGEQYQVKYWIPFSAPLFGFHDSSWQRFPYGSPKYKTDGSHGCVHLPLKTIRFLYNWVDIGTPVHIRA
jgi:lipoprotein-anchoring transpeptidase ErfK/SrfK